MMNAYVDTSVVLRNIFREAGRIEELSDVKFLISSEIVRLEALRTLDRARLDQRFDDIEIADYYSLVEESLETLNLFPISRKIFKRACEAFPTRLGSLDALHLATALEWRELKSEKNLLFLTHDRELGTAAKAVGFSVIGLD